MKKMICLYKKVKGYVNEKMLLAFAFMAMTPGLSVFANSATSDKLDNSGAKATSGITWPFESFLKAIINELSGPIPLIIGTLALIGAVGALLSGNCGEATKKILMIVIAVSIMLQAPALINFVATGAGAVIGM